MRVMWGCVRILFGSLFHFRIPYSPLRQSVYMCMSVACVCSAPSLVASLSATSSARYEFWAPSNWYIFACALWCLVLVSYMADPACGVVAILLPSV